MLKITNLLIMISMVILLSSAAFAFLVAEAKSNDVEDTSSFETNIFPEHESLFSNDVVFRSDEIFSENVFVEDLKFRYLV